MSRSPLRRLAPAVPLALASLLVATPAVASSTSTGSATTSASATTSGSATTTSTGTATGSATGTAGGPSSTTAPSATTSSTASSTTSATTATTAPTSSTTGASSTTSDSSTSTSPAPTKRARAARAYGLSAAAGPTSSKDPAAVAGGYLARELATSGGHFANSFGGQSYPDYGLTLDAVLALDAAGVGQDTARTATTYVADHVLSYVSGVDYGGASERYAGALAKTLNAAVAQGVDPTAFGGVDLVSELQAREKPSGRYEDTFDPNVSGGDYSNTFSQSFAVLGLERAGVGASAQAVAFLKLQQCPGGGFRLLETLTPCTDDGTADPDSTSLAVQALVAAQGASDPSVPQALDWLAARQSASGGFGGGTSTEAVNANSTGLASQALLAGGRAAQARRGVSYLTTLQYGCSFPAVARGGIAYNQAAYDAQAAKGRSATPDDQDRRSTAQAALALAGTPLTVVTAVGADANAPALTCAAAPATSTTSGTSTTSSTTTSATTTDASSSSSAAGAGGSSSGPGTEVAVAGSALPRTGADVLAPVVIGLLMVLLGGVAVVVTRRTGSHA